MHSSFNFYLPNQCSNEKVPKTKVVDLEILNNFGIQEFFIWGQEEGEKLNLQTAFWNFELFTRPPSSPSPSLLAPPQLLDVRVHASLVEPPRRRSSCPHRFTTPNPSSPLPRIALEPELGLPRARERNRPPWPPPSPCTPCPHLRSSSDPTEPAVPSLTYHGTPELSPSPSPAPGFYFSFPQLKFLQQPYFSF